MTALSKAEKLKIFKEYIEQYKDDVFRVALYYTKNRDDAEDLAQDAFIRAFTYFNRFKQDTNFKAWILKIMRNIFITQIKKKHYMYEHNEDQLVYSQATDQTESQALDSLRTQEIKHAINLLPQEFKEVIILCELEGYSYEEIANIVNIPVGTVRSRLHRGRLLLRERLTEKQ